MPAITRNKKAFTLIELLVVVSIIALLVSILLPALGKAREQAKAVYCRSSFKQLGLAFFYYAEDNDGFSVCNRSSSPTAPWTWEAVLVDQGYLQDYALMECPSAKDWVNTVKANMSFVGDTVIGTKLDKDTPAELYLIVDAEGNKNSHTLYDIPFYYYPGLDSWRYGELTDWYGMKFDQYFTPRHSGSFNVLFADQHVEGQDRFDVTRNSIQP